MSAMCLTLKINIFFMKGFLVRLKKCLNKFNTVSFKTEKIFERGPNIVYLRNKLS